MIVYRNWTERDPLHHRLYCEGWFLFGWIPLYVRKFDFDLPGRPGEGNE